uniref:Coenzyme Q-binding protein COQ10 homolog B,mitochondrial n=1 Tax=Neospora caninum (strain Liverpool) TaxID=572307 RepID=A0A0F7UES4_NEOCL|nr:TPA: Coenzyme Q-binding protein COQ10 homolog B,mitochondrial [Neospora caninum Liverpool]
MCLHTSRDPPCVLVFVCDSGWEWCQRDAKKLVNPVVRGHSSFRATAAREACRRDCSRPAQSPSKSKMSLPFAFLLTQTRCLLRCPYTATPGECRRGATRGSQARALLRGDAVSEPGLRSNSLCFKRHIISRAAKPSRLAPSETQIFLRTFATPTSYQLDETGSSVRPRRLQPAKAHTKSDSFHHFPSCLRTHEKPQTHVGLPREPKWGALSRASHSSSRCAPLRTGDALRASSLSSQFLSRRPGFPSSVCFPVSLASFCQSPCDKADNSLQMVNALSSARHFWTGFPSPSSLSSLLPDVFPKAAQPDTCSPRNAFLSRLPEGAKDLETATGERRREGDWGRAGGEPATGGEGDTRGRGRGMHAKERCAASCLRHAERRLVGVTPQEYFSVVKDVAKYHEFVPWCKESRIVKPPVGGNDGRESFEAELVVGFGLVSDRYTSRVSSQCPPASAASSRSSSPFRVTVDAADSSVFKTLVNCWEFRPLPGCTRSCSVDFTIEFEFNSSLHQHLAGLFLNDVAATMGRCFDARVAALYGLSSPSPDTTFSPSGSRSPSASSWAPHFPSSSQNDDSASSFSSCPQQGCTPSFEVHPDVPENRLAKRRGAPAAGTPEARGDCGDAPAMPHSEADAGATLERTDVPEAAEADDRTSDRRSARCASTLGTRPGSASALSCSARDEEEGAEICAESGLRGVLPRTHVTQGHTCDVGKASAFPLSNQALNGSPSPADLAFLLGRLRRLRKSSSSPCSSPCSSPGLPSSSSSLSSVSSASFPAAGCEGVISPHLDGARPPRSGLPTGASVEPALERSERRVKEDESISSPQQARSFSSPSRLSALEERLARQLLLGPNPRATASVIAVFLALDPRTPVPELNPLTQTSSVRSGRAPREGETKRGKGQEKEIQRANPVSRRRGKRRVEAGDNQVMAFDTEQENRGERSATAEPGFDVEEAERSLVQALRDLVNHWTHHTHGSARSRWCRRKTYNVPKTRNSL